MKISMEKLGNRKAIYIIVTILIIISFFSFFKFRTKAFFLQSKTLFDVVYQSQTVQFTQYPFWIITNQDFNYSEKEYIIGDNVKIFGKNVAELNGSKINIVEHDLKEIVGNNDEFYRTIFNISESYKDDGGVYLKALAEVVDDEEKEEISSKIKSVKKIMEPYVNSGKIILLNLLVNKSIENDIVVERIEIGDLIFDFDYFKITVEDYMNESSVDEYINILSYGGYGEYSFNPSNIYYEFTLKSLSDIDSLEFYNINGNTKFDTFRYIQEKIEKTDIPEGETGTIPVEFEFDNTQYPENITDFDILATTVLIDISLNDNKKFSVSDMILEGRQTELIMFRLYNELLEGEK